MDMAVKRDRQGRRFILEICSCSNIDKIYKKHIAMGDNDGETESWKCTSCCDIKKFRSY